jgi:hypothetical protein
MNSLRSWLWAAWLFLVPFALLTLAYDSLPEAIPLFRAWDGQTIVGAKSWLTVFRPALIDALSGFVAFWLGRRAARAAAQPVRETSEVWWRLFVTAGLKSVLQGIEMAQSVVPDVWRSRAALGSVVVVSLGILWTLAALRTHGPILRRSGSWEFRASEKAALALLGALYVLVAFGPLATSRS